MEPAEHRGFAWWLERVPALDYASSEPKKEGPRSRNMSGGPESVRLVAGDFLHANLFEQPVDDLNHFVVDNAVLGDSFL